MEILDLSGIWQCEIPGQSAPIRLPGTLDESHIGFPDSTEKQWHLENARKLGFWQEGDPIVTRLTRKYTYEGQAKISRKLKWMIPAGKRVFLECERARHVKLYVNGQEAPWYQPVSISTPYVFEITPYVTGNDSFLFLSDNTYPGWPYEPIIRSSAAADETQTNWNGMLGYLRLRIENQVFLSNARVYPHHDTLDVCAVLDAACHWHGVIHLDSEALEQNLSKVIDIQSGITEVWIRNARIKENLPLWDMEEGNLQTLSLSAMGLETKTVHFGLRSFQAKEGHFVLNSRRIFLRSEANCAVFPETGYLPMTVEAWKEILKTYQSYGVNCMRFHSHCPPEAAFFAADELGMLMQPELSNWDPKDAFSNGEKKQYYQTELMQILNMLANHPSFVMLTLGNELHTNEEGHAFMDQLLSDARTFDNTRLYANGSNTHYGLTGEDPQSDFYTSMAYFEDSLRATSNDFQGWLNQEYPNTQRDYSDAMKKIRTKTQQPVFSFEVGQYEVLPDFDEIADYRGVTEPDNLRLIQKRVNATDMKDAWKKLVEASGELSLLCYRAEVEAALRTEDYSGISLLGLQDFPGQGTALVGMLNAHLKPKPYDFAQPKHFNLFFRDVLPLVLLPKFTFFSGETLSAQVKLAHYGKTTLCGRCMWRLEGDGFSIKGDLPEVNTPAGGLFDLGTIHLSLPETQGAKKLTLTVDYCGATNTYPLWIYADEMPVCPSGVYECREMDDYAYEVLSAGGCVYLSPDQDKMSEAIPTQFSTDFWSVCSFPNQAGCMGQFIDTDHPIFQHFPTEKYTDWQWWLMATSCALPLPDGCRPIISEMPAITSIRPLAQLYEQKRGKGTLIVSSMALHRKLQFPEARALQREIYNYCRILDSHSDSCSHNHSLSEGL